MAPLPRPQFWIDVGGTFTDCLTRTGDSAIRTFKLLSSGVFRGKLDAASTCKLLRDRARIKDPARFFEGYEVTIYQKNPDGTDLEIADDNLIIKAFDNAGGDLALNRPMCCEPEAGMWYELRSHEEAPVTGIRWLMGLRLDEDIGEVEVRLGTTRGTNALLERKGAPTAFVTTAGFGDILVIGNQSRPRLFDLNIRKPALLYREVVELKERLDAGGKVLVPLDPAEVRTKLAKLRQDGIQA
ncbi:hydantoinase/oxoprolinase N-terminal domain-containing protein, partial [Planctomycetota bacterium]